MIFCIFTIWQEQFFHFFSQDLLICMHFFKYFPSHAGTCNLQFLFQTGFDIIFGIADQMKLERIHQILHHIRA